MDEIKPVKLNKPLKDKDGSFYPLTTYDQIIMPDNSRWDGNNKGLTINNEGKIMEGNKEVHVDATTLNGMTLEQMIQRIMSEAVYQ